MQPRESLKGVYLYERTDTGVLGSAGIRDMLDIVEKITHHESRSTQVRRGVLQYPGLRVYGSAGLIPL